MATSTSLLKKHTLGMPWTTLDPFLFCVYHLDNFPAGNERMEVPPELLRGRRMGNDFSNKDGFSMYHGPAVPGFPVHPHAGFETVTVVRHGLVDHSDSMGATARFGGGDLQWLTAGKGISHCEMMPLVHSDKGNPLELFQIWLNLPPEDKKCEPAFSIAWRESMSSVSVPDANGRPTVVTVYAGRYGDTAAGQPPPPNSWASRPDSDVAIWTLRIAPGGRFTLPPAKTGSNRMLYFFVGGQLSLDDGEALSPRIGLQLNPEVPASLRNLSEDKEAELLLLQGRPIGAPVVQHGPFVANSQAEMRAIMADYSESQFGGWPWGSDHPTHPREADRFAVHADGHRDAPPGSA
eukprot:c23_g1_i1.p2 GENE.c23_g1_i1~~c23_g1_i1.p2  ORF type:complete len:387 (-),score=51.04 c23_g1_i1:31-1077(-)